MLFNSLAFVLFFPIVVISYFALPWRFRNLFLLAASCFFYMYFNPVFILILVYTIAVDFVAGKKIEQHLDNRKLQKRWLYASLFANIGALVLFKYANFLLITCYDLLDIVRVPHSNTFVDIVLPIGLSFHTFQAISYTIEVYRGHQKAERNLIDYSLYVMFFPQLVAGPIERPQRLLPQFKMKHTFSYSNFSVGMKLIIWGLFKKVVVADNLAIIVDSVYNNPYPHQGLSLMVATVLFAFQIYGDFSGYSDIAKGTARVMGFDLMTNFNLPYFSQSVAEFWRRWHISLSTWFKDYIYIRLGGNRTKTFRNIFITFALSGLWHGANFTYAIWGILNGIFVYLQRFFTLRAVRVPAVLKIIGTFILIDFCWIFFRANTLKDVSYIIRNAWTNVNIESLQTMGVERHYWIVALGVLVFMLATEWYTRHTSVIDWWLQISKIKKLVFLNMLLFMMLFFGVFEHRTFIYFQF